MSRYKIFLSFSKSGQIVKKSDLYKVHSEILCSYVDGTRARDYNYYLVNNYLYVFFSVFFAFALYVYLIAKWFETFLFLIPNRCY